MYIISYDNGVHRDTMTTKSILEATWLVIKFSLKGLNIHAMYVNGSGVKEVLY